MIAQLVLQNLFKKLTADSYSQTICLSLSIASQGKGGIERDFGELGLLNPN